MLILTILHCAAYINNIKKKLEGLTNEDKVMIIDINVTEYLRCPADGLHKDFPKKKGDKTTSNCHLHKTDKTTVTTNGRGHDETGNISQGRGGMVWRLWHSHTAKKVQH